MTVPKIYLMLLTSSGDAESIVSKLLIIRNKNLITLEKGTSSSLQRKYYTIILKRGDQRIFRKKIRVICWVVVLLILWDQIS